MAAESFAYEAQTLEGSAVSGTIDAADVEQASRLLQGLRLRIIEIAPTARPPRTKPLVGDDFLAFNQQLMHLTRAGLPVEHGLRLIAQDMRSGRLAATVRSLAAEMEKGTPLDQAFAKHSAEFPPLYAQLVAAGVASGNLPGMLLNLGRHMEMVYRLRAMLWRAMAYPLAVLGGLAIVILFVALVVVPEFEELFKGVGVKLPAITIWFVSAARWMPGVIIAFIVLVIAIPIVWRILRKTGADRPVVDRILVPLPLIGSVLWRNMVARWCDAARLAIQAGLDLPRAIELAGDAVASPTLKADGRELIATLQSGQPLDRAADTMLMLPATVPAVISLATQQTHDLAMTLGTLSDMYQQQAETRLGAIPGLLTPLLVIIVGIVVGTVILAMFLPFITLISGLMH
jgi:type IV pilus assembly protein PilC